MKKVAIIGCGFVSNYYMLTLSKSKTLQVVGVLDLIEERATKVAQRYAIPKIYHSLEELVADDAVEIVLNLTNPRVHYETTRVCLEHAKHVYSEKPLAMTVPEAKELVELAEQKGVHLSSAPCSLLGEVAQTLWKAIRENQIGTVRLVYAEMDDNMVHKMGLDGLYTSLGVPWPAKDEFEIGCTLEHAGYYLPWLVAFFGPAKNVTAFASCLIPDKMPGVKLDPPDAPDFTVACIEFESGVVARLTCGIVARHDHSLTVIGDTGSLRIEDAWDYGATVRLIPHLWNRNSEVKTPLQKFGLRVRRKAIRHVGLLQTLDKLEYQKGRKQPLVREVPEFDWEMGLRMDFSRGVEEMAAAIDEKRPNRLSSRFSLHVNELALVIHGARDLSHPYRMTTTFEPVEPMPWAK